MAQFYTDPSGHIFTLKKIFSNYGAAFSDIGLSWQSPISVGEYVLISYGDRNKKYYVNSGTKYYSSSYQEVGTTSQAIEADWDEESDYGTILINNTTYYVRRADLQSNPNLYEKNAQIDLENESGYAKKSWNGVLLQKIYNATTGNLEYKELVNYTGYTPQISYRSFTRNANQEPYFNFVTAPTPSLIVDGITIDCTNASYETPILVIGLPQAKGIAVQEEIVETEPSGEAKVEDIGNANETKLKFTIPRAQKIIKNNDVILDADQLPSIESEENADGDLELTFKIPLTERFVGSSITFDDEQTPSVDFGDLYKSGDDPAKRFRDVTFILPKWRTFREACEVNLISASSEENPTVTLSKDGAQQGDDPNFDYYKLNFKLPKTFEQTVGITNVSRAAQPSGEITDSGNKLHLELNLPQVETWRAAIEEWLNPGASPEVRVDDDDLDNLVLRFKMPRALNIETIADITPVGPEDPGKVSLNKDYTTTEGIEIDTFSFSLPRAGKFVIGEQVPGLDGNLTVFMADMEPGDRYINQTTGRVYLAKSKDVNKNVTFEYEARIISPGPQISTDFIQPYSYSENDGYTLNKPNASGSFDTDGVLTGIKFELPIQRIVLDEESAFVASIDDQKIELNPGEAVIDGKTSTCQKLLIKIPQGSIRFLADYTINPDVTSLEDLDNTVIDAEHYGKIPNDIGVINVAYGTDTYWYFGYTEQGILKLGRSKISGTGLSLVSDYPGSDSTNQAYSVTAVNKIVVNEYNSQLPSPNKQTYSATVLKQKIDTINTNITNINNQVAENTTNLAKEYSITIPANGDYVLDQSYLKYSVSIPTLNCGKTQTIPPIIAPLDNLDEQYHLYLKFADCTPNEGIDFYFIKQPTHDIQLIVIDNI